MFVEIRSNEERHLLVLKCNVMLAYTSNTTPTYAQRRNVLSEAHTHTVGSHTSYIYIIHTLSVALFQ